MSTGGDKSCVVIEDKFLDVGAVIGANFEASKRRIYVYLPGGRFMQFNGPAAVSVWEQLQQRAIVLKVDSEVAGTVEVYDASQVHVS